MVGANWIDLVILLLLAGAVYYGRRLGFLTVTGTIVGFFAGLLVGGALFPHLIPLHDRTIRTIINGNLVLCTAIYGAVKGNDFGRRGHRKLLPGVIRRFETLSGSLVIIASVLALAWLLAAMVGRLPFAGLSNSVDDALIIQSLDRHLPPAPAVFASFNHEVSGNNSPLLFENQPSAPGAAVGGSAAQVFPPPVPSSTVRITSFGCGGIVSGSGFVVAPELVMTNAHVVAGVKRPIIKAAGRSYEGVPVFFDQNLDVAILRVRQINLPPVSFDTRDNTGESVLTAGYPNGNFSERAGVLRSNFILYGRNIYDIGVIGRDIYEIQVQSDEGSSGSPVLSGSGKVVGMLFAKSEIVDGYSYALTAKSLQPSLQRAQRTHTRVSTGSCLAS
jgi:S1-C subfamily serine protease